MNKKTSKSNTAELEEFRAHDVTPEIPRGHGGFRWWRGGDGISRHRSSAQVKSMHWQMQGAWPPRTSFTSTRSTSPRR
jgi:hypothetical protein